MKFKFLILLFIVLLGSGSCQYGTTQLEYALKSAGANRIELEKVLLHYSKQPSDSLKFRAACFLIENMRYYYSYEGELLDQYLPIYEALIVSNKKPEEVVDSFKLKYGLFSIDKLQKKYDIKEVKGDFLINNIEWSFKVWETQPWGKNVSFNDFCEFILPYRIGDEQLSEWRQKLYQRYNPLLDSLINSGNADNPIDAARVIIDSLSKKDYVFTGMIPGLPHAGSDINVHWMAGSCRDLAGAAIYICRALGIPCGLDFVPLRGNNNVGHEWNFFLDKNGKTFMQEFPFPVKPAAGGFIAIDHISKVYRETFSINQMLHEKMNSLDCSLPAFFQQPTFIDVTPLYADVLNRSIVIPSSQLYPIKRKGKIAYLCFALYQTWSPIAWTEFRKDSIQFNDVEGGNVVRIATYENGELVYHSDPILIDRETGSLEFIRPKSQAQTLVVLSKFTLIADTHFRNCMVNGVFEGSNTLDFKETDTLFVIKELPIRAKTRVTIENNKKYRYLRYCGPDSSHCNVAEIGFYGDKFGTILLHGKIIGTPGCLDMDGSHEYTNVFDGKTTTSFDYKEPNGGWAGLDLGAPQVIQSIIYTPRNWDNYIKEGNLYEAFFFDKKWISLGKMISSSDSLLYEDVPVGTLYYIRNHSGGNQEHIFTYKNGRQIWW